jgi:predicted alpha/beta superfamily hydrolase
MRRVSLVLLSLAFAFSSIAQGRPDAALQIESKILGETRTAIVRLPASYERGTAAYPVLYLTDGDRQLPHLSAVVDFLSREGRMPEVILVGVTNTDRTRDLTPTPVVNAVIDGQSFNFPTSGGANRFLDFFETELIPQIESRYRTQPYRAFAGHSFGGLFALHALFTRPKLFNAVIAVSPSLNWDDRYVYRMAQKFVADHRETNATLFFTMGEEGEASAREMRALSGLLEKRAPKGLVWASETFRDEDHGSVVLPSHYAALRRVFAPWRFVIDRNEDPRATFKRANEHYAAVSKRAGFAIPIPEPTINFMGYRLLQANHVKEAIDVFKANVERYPDSANVYDSLGEAYERAGDRENARWNYAKAAELGKKANDPNTAIFERNRDRMSR